ncbi:hypothetical protein ABBQ32_003380 [Trebouxia sp. C0010 RCD-2024]
MRKSQRRCYRVACWGKGICSDMGRPATVRGFRFHFTIYAVQAHSSRAADTADKSGRSMVVSKADKHTM